MEAIEATVRFDAQGKLFPVQFAWRGRVYPVASTGRRWQSQEGRNLLLHMLVMTIEAKAYELVFDLHELRWYMKTPEASLQIALST